MSEKMLVKDVIFREDLYPRFESNQALIERYSNAVDNLPPIMVNQDNILIDGFHRWKAHQMADHDEIAFEIIETASEADLEVLAYRYNSIHGLQLSSDEKATFAQKKIGIIDVKEIADIVSVDVSTVNRWTKNQRAAIKKERNRRIMELYLRAWNTQEKVAEILKIAQQTVSDVIASNTDSAHMLKIGKDFEPKLYNIWNMPKADKETKHFGYFPEEFMANILYYHTEPLDIIYDPFAGSGTTVDICKKWLRRYYCSDRIVTPGREQDIKQRDIVEGVPADIPKNKPVFVFLDPPYWIQAEGEYSDDTEDLGNMDLATFYITFNNFLEVLKEKKFGQIAIVIQPTQYKNDLVWEDHIFEFGKILDSDYRIDMRYILPYSTEQYTPQCIEKAKERGACLGLNRDLVVWKRRTDEDLF